MTLSDWAIVMRGKGVLCEGLLRSFVRALRMEIEAQARMEEFLVTCCVRSSDDMTERIKFNGILASCKDYRESDISLRRGEYSRARIVPRISYFRSNMSRIPK